MNHIETYIKRKHNEYINEDNKNNILNYSLYYSDVGQKELGEVFGYFHYSFNYLFKFLNEKKNKNGHYNADSSRELITLIEEIETIQREIKNSKFSFTIKPEYLKYIKECKEFLVASHGSPIPDNLEPILTIETQPIFKINSSVEIKKHIVNLKVIGEGSYATVSKYKDREYNKFFAIKKIKDNLNTKEITRFQNEFKYMKSLDSPYILEVYTFNEKNNSYIMEYADTTLEKYISNNNNHLDIRSRVNIINQIFKAFEYINHKLGFHRDISTTNILLKKYDNLWVVKVSDFGLVKEKKSLLTSFDTEFKGSLNDPKLNIVGGFKNYTAHHETFALTRLIYFIITGKRRIEKYSSKEFQIFIENGISDNINFRYKDVKSMRLEFQKIIAFL